MMALAGCGGGTSPSQVAQAAGASSCDKSDYYLIIKTTGEHETIYDCVFPSGLKCVTYQNGIANDSTEVARLVFSTSLGTPKPSCLG